MLQQQSVSVENAPLGAAGVAGPHHGDGPQHEPQHQQDKSKKGEPSRSRGHFALLHDAVSYENDSPCRQGMTSAAAIVSGDEVRLVHCSKRPR